MSRRSSTAFAVVCALALPAALARPSLAPISRPDRRVAAAPQAMPALEPFAPNLTWSSSDVFKEVASIRGEDAPDYHGTAFWYNGRLGIVFAKGMFEGGISLFDITDPRNPKLTGKGNHALQREGHTTGFMESDAGILAVSMASNGLNLWDLNDATKPRVFRNVQLQGIKPSDYDFGAWWTGVQAPYVYLAGSYNGLYIVDLSDLNRPRLVDRILMDGGFRCGAMFVVGNLLVQSSSEGLLTRIYDISDPESPQLVKEVEQTYTSYATHFNGGLFFTAMETGGLEIFDFHDPSSPESLSVTFASGGGAYIVVQDGAVHLGNSSAFYKIDYSDPLKPFIIGSASITTELEEVDNDFASPIGNFTVISDDHNLTQYNAGSRIVPTQTAQDKTPPQVNFVSPADGAEGVATTSRVGITLTGPVLVTSANAQSFIIREAGGAQVPGVYSVQHGIVNFSPATTLLPETDYEVVVPAGGLRDYVGNAVPAQFLSTFRTGVEYVNPPNANAGSDKTGYVGEPVLLDASRTTGGQGSLEYSWDPGDGSSSSPWSTNPALNYVYATAAHRTAIVKVRDSAGQITSDSARISVVERPLPVPPTSSASMSLDAGSDQIWAVNPDSDTVAVIDALQVQLQKEIAVGKRPTTVASTGQGDVWVVNQESADITVIDAVGLSARGRIALTPGSRPFGVARDPSDEVMYVTLEGTGRLLALDAISGATIWSADVGPTPRGIAVVEESIFVSRFISPAQNGEVIEVDRSSGQPLQAWTLAESPGPDSENNGRGIPNYLTQLVPSPDGHRVFVPSIKQNTNRGQFKNGEALTFESTNRAILSVLDLDAGEEDLAARLDFDNRDHASALALSEYGDYGFVALQGSQGVIVADLLNGQEVGSIPYVGHAPQALVLTLDGLLFIQNFMGRDVSVYDVSTFQDVESMVRVATLRTVGAELMTQEALVGKRIFYDAADTRMSRDSYISCAGCHLDGGSDRRVWDFTDRGEGLRRTVPMRGHGGMLHGPVHWTANFDEIQDFENDIRNAFGGTGFMSDTDFNTGTRSSTLGDPKAGISPELDAMAAYAMTLTVADASPNRNADGSLTDAAKRGRDLFRSSTVGCNGCHTGPNFSDSVLTSSSSPYVLHDVGTLTAASGQRMGQPLTGLDTPTLKGVWNNAPYLHDGSAPTLRDVLVTRNTAQKHGDTAQLTSTQLSDLEAYLNAIDARSGAPVATAMIPANGTKLRAPKRVTVGFSSWPDPTSVTTSTFKVKRDGTAVSGTLAVDRDRVTFTPGGVMASGTYTVEVTTSIKSIDGDAAVAWTGTFQVADVALVSNVKAWTSRASSYSLQSGLKAGVKIFGDDDERTVKVPTKYAGLDYIRTANGDREESRPVALTFDLSAPAKVYVAFSRRMTHLPGWASDFQATGDSIIITDTASPMPVYVGNFPAGKMLLGGAAADGGEGAKVNYFVFFAAQ